MNATPRFLQLADVAEILNISGAQVYALVRRGDLRAIKIGGRGQWRVEASELEAYIERAYADADRFVDDHPFVEGSGQGLRRRRPSAGHPVRPCSAATALDRHHLDAAVRGRSPTWSSKKSLPTRPIRPCELLVVDEVHQARRAPPESRRSTARSDTGPSPTTSPRCRRGRGRQVTMPL